MSETEANLAEVRNDPEIPEDQRPGRVPEAVADKGYHRHETVRDWQEREIRSYVSEPKYRGRRRGKDKGSEQRAVSANRRRIRGRRGKTLLRKRGELLERPFAHCYETGGMRRTPLRTHARILKRRLVPVAGGNRGLLRRTLLGVGTPRGLQGLLVDLLQALRTAVHWFGHRHYMPKRLFA